MAINAYNRYQEQSVMTMTNGEMLTKLYDKAASQLKAGSVAIEQKDMTAAAPCLNRAQEILNYLRATLDFRFPVSNSLDSLYVFFNQQIVMANVKRDATLLKEIIPMIEELRDTFSEADKRTRQQSSAAAGSSLSNSYG